VPRYRLDIEYDGTSYAGWQRQAGQHSVQAALEQALQNFCAEHVSLRGAGRTDAGVHAAGQVAHVDLARDWPAQTVRDAVNAHLRLSGETVCVLAASRARQALSLSDSQSTGATGSGAVAGMVGGGAARRFQHG
jgi:tRNA pseudouridine38-40 synthase